ncbi:MAG: hypothetical protein K9N51_11195 [Candidatus Pacebacteria bacterium]|nr:hypothetical protein [Candidatus Paceibacterota bacterium]
MATPMTSCERLLAAIRRQPVDYVPCCGFFNALTPQQRRGYTWNFPWPRDARYEEQLRYQVEQLGLDQIVPVAVDAIQPEPGIESRTWLDGDMLHKSYATPAGELHAAIRYNDLWPHGKDIPFYTDFNIGHFVEPWLQTHEDLECFKQLRAFAGDDYISKNTAALEQGKALARRYGLAIAASVGMGLTGAQQLFGAAELCLLTIDHPELVEAYLDHEHQLNLRLIELYADLGVDVIMRNGFYETADFYSPDTLERLLALRLFAEASAIRRHGMVSAYTVHTGVMPILDYLARLPLDSYRGIDIAFNDVDMYKISEKLGADHAIWTGPSSTYHIWKGPAETRQAVRDVFECFDKRCLILCQCVSSHSIMPWESTLAMIDEWKKLR